jgi:DUF1009 family protein
MSQAAAGQQGPLALICGGGTLPLAVADFVSGRGRKVVLFPLRGAAEGTAVERYPHHWLHVGQIGKCMRLARAAGCRDVIFIGSLVRPSLWQVRPDLKGLTMLPRVIKAFRGGDNHLLSGMGKLFEQEGFRMLGAHEVAPEILIPDGTLGRVQAQRIAPTGNLASTICVPPDRSTSARRWLSPASMCWRWRRWRAPT